MSGRLRLGFLLEEVPELDKITHPKDHRKWKACTDMVHSWLQSLITAELQPSFLSADNPWTLWSELAIRYNKSNGAMLYDVLVQTYTVTSYLSM